MTKFTGAATMARRRFHARLACSMMAFHVPARLLRIVPAVLRIALQAQLKSWRIRDHIAPQVRVPREEMNRKAAMIQSRRRENVPRMAPHDWLKTCRILAHMAPHVRVPREERKRKAAMIQLRSRVKVPRIALQDWLKT